jgi:hypothetical protein
MRRPWLVSTKQGVCWGSPAMPRRKVFSWAKPAGEWETRREPTSWPCWSSTAWGSSAQSMPAKNTITSFKVVVPGPGGLIHRCSKHDPLSTLDPGECAGEVQSFVDGRTVRR